MRSATTVFALALLSLAILTAGFPTAAGSPSVDSWVKINVNSFNGETISLDMQIFVRGNRLNESVKIRGEFENASGVSLEVGRELSDKVYAQG